MKRVWIVDNAIPAHRLGVDLPYPGQLSSKIVQHLIEHAGEHWEEEPVLNLCRAFCAPEFEATFFLSPEAMLSALEQSAIPPHAVVFDWEGPGFSDDSNRAALIKLLESAFVYVQVYTQYGEGGVDPKITDLRDRFRNRLLPTKGKDQVTPEVLRDDIMHAWKGTIAGDIADTVRRETVAAVEQALIEFGGVPASVLAAMADKKIENLLHMVFAKLRDEISDTGFEVLDDIFRSPPPTESTEDLRRLLSVWYYYFPHDDLIRRGDVVELTEPDQLGLVVTPACDLARFPQKTGRRLTWLQIVSLDADGNKYLDGAGIKIDQIGPSIISGHPKDTAILLPNVPAKHGSRDSLKDYVVLSHSWNSCLCREADGGPLKYSKTPALKRRCTLAEPFSSAVITKAISVIASAGTPDLPQSERTRLGDKAKEGKSIAAAPAGQKLQS